MTLYYGISPISTASYYYVPQTPIVGSSAYGGNFIQGNSSGDLIYGETQDSLYSGAVGGNTIYGGNGSNTIYGDAYGLYGTITAHSNTIYADAPNAQDSSAVNTVYGNACVMGGDSTGGTDQSGTVVGNSIWDSVGNTSYLYGNAYSMTDHAWGGYNTIHARSYTSSTYGDAYQISGSATFDWTHGLGVHGGHNIINLDGESSANGYAYGDAYSIAGVFDGGHNQIWINSNQNATVYGTAYTLNGTINCGSNLINDYYSNATIYGDAYQNLAGSNVTAGCNIIHGPIIQHDLRELNF